MTGQTSGDRPFGRPLLRPFTPDICVAFGQSVASLRHCLITSRGIREWISTLWAPGGCQAAQVVATARTSGDAVRRANPPSRCNDVGCERCDCQWQCIYWREFDASNDVVLKPCSRTYPLWFSTQDPSGRLMTVYPRRIRGTKRRIRQWERANPRDKCHDCTRHDASQVWRPRHRPFEMSPTPFPMAVSHGGEKDHGSEGSQE